LRCFRSLPVLACAVLACAAGCRPAHDGGGVTVEFWAMGREGESVKQLVPAFEAENPGVRVRVQQIPWSAAHEKLLTALVGGTMPDAFQLGATWVSELAVLRALEPLDALVQGSAGVSREDFFPGILAANVVDGTTYGLPWYVDTRVLFVRRDLTARAGCDAAPRDWTAWRDCMTRVARRAGPDGHAILLPLTEWETLVILAMQRGATLLRDGDRRGDFRSAAFRDAFAFYLSLFERGLAPRGGEAQAANLYQGFGEGLFSFVVTGPWNLAQFADRLPARLAGAWSVAPMPAAEDPGAPGVSLAGGASLAVWRGSPRKDAAWRWAEFLAAPAQQEALHRAAGSLPARRSAWHALALDQEPRTRAFWEQLAHVRPPPRVPEWERIATEIGRRAESVIRGDQTIDAAVAGLDADVDRILAKRRWLLARRVAEPQPPATPGATP
jgi:multiple sugar transport system substrate-binding protein